MFEVDNDQIKITRGDSAALKVGLTMKSGVAYQMQEGDALVLTVRRAPGANKLVELATDTDTITFVPTDTKDLDAGEYCFDIQLTTAGGDVFTVVGMKTGTLTNFTVLPDVSD